MIARTTAASRDDVGDWDGSAVQCSLLELLHGTKQGVNRKELRKLLERLLNRLAASNEDAVHDPSQMWIPGTCRAAKLWIDNFYGRNQVKELTKVEIDSIFEILKSGGVSNRGNAKDANEDTFAKALSPRAFGAACMVRCVGNSLHSAFKKVPSARGSMVEALVNLERGARTRSLAEAAVAALRRWPLSIESIRKHLLEIDNDENAVDRKKPAVRRRRRGSSNGTRVAATSSSSSSDALSKASVARTTMAMEVVSRRSDIRPAWELVQLLVGKSVTRLDAAWRAREKESKRKYLSREHAR